MTAQFVAPNGAVIADMSDSATSRAREARAAVRRATWTAERLPLGDSGSDPVPSTGLARRLVDVSAVSRQAHLIWYNERLAPDILDFMVALDQHRVDAVLVGGYAVGVYGVVLATSDIDFLYRRTSANVQRLCRVLEAFGAPPTAIDPKALLTPDMVTMFGVPPFRIDLLNDISGVEFGAVWRGSHVVTLEGTPIRVIGLAALRANKASTGRAKDKADLRRLPKAL